MTTGSPEYVPSFTRLPDLASRTVGGAVVWANDEFFGEKEALLKPGPATFSPHTFGNKGQVVDGWETRRRRPGGPGVDGTEHDSAIVRLGIPGVIRGVTVDTAHFLGNYPPRASIEAIAADGFPTPADLVAADWKEVIPAFALAGGTPNHRAVDRVERRFTHVRLTMIPDGGIARFRVYGEAVPDPQFLRGLPVDLAALRNGGRVTDASDMFFSPPEHAIMPGESRAMGEGWETRRRRDSGFDWLEIRLAARGTIDVVEIDTANYRGNPPDTVVLLACDRPDEASEPSDADWFELIPSTRVLADYCHRFRLDSPRQATHLRLEVHPDGGIARLRAYGTLTESGLEDVTRRWLDTLR